MLAEVTSLRRCAAGAATALAALALLGSGCGAKTGLLVPEPEEEPPEREDLCVDVDPEDLTADLDLEVTTRLLSADVFFLVDCTGSMRGEITNIQRSLATTIVPGALQQVPDVRFGVGAVADFAVADYGAGEDLPFEMRRAITDDVAAVQAAIDGLPRWDGGDEPEAQVEALYQVAAGEGLLPFIEPSAGCPRRGLGYPCFREGSQPVVVLITDAPFHNGPLGDFPYIGIYPTPHGFEDAVSALETLGARVVGIDSGQARQDLETIARRTGAVDSDGVPLVYSISPSGVGLGDEVVHGIETLALRVPVDVDAIAVDVPGDDLDATTLVQRIVAVSADPPTGVSGIEGDTFFDAMPGTRLRYRLEVHVDVSPIPARTTLYPVLIRFRADEVSVLDERVVYIEVPGLDGREACEDVEE
jgi:hypothetical protein